MLQTVLPREIIIIDDASRTPVARDIVDIAKEYRSLGVTIRILRTKREIGLGAARSIGARIALGRYIVFLDDDAIASKQLIESYIETFKSSRCDIVAGPCYPRYLGLSCQRLPLWWDEVVLGGLIAVRNDIVYLSGEAKSPADYVFGCNFAISKYVLKKVKGFKPWLGRIKGTLLSGEEWDFVTRALNKGFRVCFAKKAIVFHLIPYTKISIERIRRMGIGMGKTRCLLAYEHCLDKSLSFYLLRCATALYKDLIEMPIHLLLNDRPKFIRDLYNLIVHSTSFLMCKRVLKDRAQLFQ